MVQETTVGFLVAVILGLHRLEIGGNGLQFAEDLTMPDLPRKEKSRANTMNEQQTMQKAKKALGLDKYQ